MSAYDSPGIASFLLQSSQARIGGELSVSIMKGRAEADQAIIEMLTEQAELLKALTYGGDGRSSLPAVGTSIDLFA